MRLTKGGYQFDENAVGLRVAREAIKNDFEQWYAEKIVWTADGRIEGSGQADIAGKLEIFEAALRRLGEDIYFLRDDGVPAMRLTNSGSTTGVVCTNFSYDNFLGAEFANYRTWSATFEAEYALTPGAAIYLAFEESLEFDGGGPEFLHKRAAEGLPQKQRVFEATEYKIIQQGRAETLNAIPAIPPPIWPGAMMRNPHIGEARRRKGVNGVSWSRSWAYLFESVTPLVGVPTLGP